MELPSWVGGPIFGTLYLLVLYLRRSVNIFAARIFWYITFDLGIVKGLLLLFCISGSVGISLDHYEVFSGPKIV